MKRRDFLKQASTGITAAAALTTLSSIQAVFANNLLRLEKQNNKDDYFANLGSEYLLNPEITYFNHGSIGTIPRVIHEAHTGYLKLCESNPWLYMWGGPWAKALAETREKIAKFVGCSAGELAFTHNTTEGFNLLASGLPLKAGDEVVFSSLNHAGAGQCWFHYAKEKDFSVKKFEFPIQEVPNLSRDDIVDIYARNISEKTRVVVFPHIDNLVGIRYPVKELAEMARDKGVQYVAVDGAQAVGMVDVNLQEMGIDFYAASPHKWLQAPKGTGLLYIRKELQSHLKPMWVTWGQERWQGSVRIFEDYGTRNLAEVLTLGNAVDFQTKLNSKGAEQRRKELRDTFYQALKNNSKFIWRSPLDPDLATSLYTVELKETSSRALFKEMFEKHGYVFRPFESENWHAIRLSLNVFNTFEEIDRFNKLAG